MPYIMNIKYYLLLPTLLCALPANATPLYPAQVVGRDLNEPLITWAGHVGITIGNNPYERTENIIEVLPQINAIQINTVSDFKQHSYYWGSRYGIADRQASAQNVIDEALKQRALCPTFTQSDSYQIGLGTPDNPIRCAVFRCDTFVNHVFHTAGHDLPTYHGISLPLRVFYAFPKSHHDHETTHGSPIDDIDDIDMDMPRDDFNAFKLKVDLPKNKTTFKSIHNLWALAKNPHLGLNKRIFILDYLGLNGTSDLIEEFISYYETQTDPNIKNMLVRSTFTLYQTHFLAQPHEKLQAFYQNLLSKPLTDEEVPFVIRGFVTLSSTNQVFMSQLQINKQLNQHTSTLPSETALQLNMLLAFKSSLLESYYMFRMIQILINTNNADLNQQFEQALISRFTRFGTKKLSPESKQLLQTHASFLNLSQF